MQGFRQEQEQKQQQVLRLTPQQLLVAQLLELSNIELEERIRKEAEENPALEVVEGSEDEVRDESLPEEGEAGNNEEEFSVEDYLNDDDNSLYDISVNKQKEHHTDQFWAAAQQESFYDFIRQQFLLRDITERQQIIGDFLINSMDDDGYIRRSFYLIITDIATSLSLDVTMEELEEVLQIIQQLEPTGVGARSLQECLLLQLQPKLQTQEPSIVLAYKIIQKHFDNFANKRYKKILESLHITPEELKEAEEEILKLTAKPGFGDSATTNMEIIRPDFIVDYKNGKLTCELTSGTLPHIEVSKEIEKLKHQLALQSKETTAFVKRNLMSAHHFIDAVAQRNQKLLTIMQTIVHLQYDYFSTGEQSELRPMVIKNIQEIIGYDISVISRAISKKYVQTPFGVIAIKSIFSEAMSNKEGEDISSLSIKDRILKLLESENPQQPVTDEQLTDLLNEEGIDIARRTVAKYREQLGIQPARLRKKLI